MSKIYVTAHLTIHDPETYESYGSKFMEVLSGFDGKLLGVVDGPDVVEGNFEGTRAVLLEFASREEFDRWYMSEAYQDILKFRLAASSGTIVLIPALG